MNKLAIIAVTAVTIISLIILVIFLKIPSAKTLRGCLTTEMFQVNLCPGSSNYVPLSKISKYLQKTVVLTEDSSFFQHDGFDWDSLEKNAKENLKKGEFKRGGSTITQQLAKNLFLSKEKTLTRKFFEFLITMKIEKILTKREILERYLNVIEFGKNTYGVKAAALLYFQKSPSELSVVESAFLAALLPSPVKYSRSFFKKELSPFLRNRLRQIIKNLYQYQIITSDEFNVAANELHNFLNPNGIDDEFSLDAVDSVDEDSSELDEFELSN